MVKVEAMLETSYSQIGYRKIFEFDIDVTDEEIEEAVTDWAMSCIDIGWTRID